jgi:FkbM family methyltransferase
MMGFVQWLASVGRKLANRPATTEVPPSDRGRDAPFAIQVDPTDERGRQLKLSGGDFNPPALKMWTLLLASGSWTHVLDVGANYGEMIFNAVLPPDTRVIVIDANPSIIPFLTRNLERAGIRAQVICTGISDRVGQAEFLQDTHWSGTSRLAAEGEMKGEAMRAITVPITTISAVLAEQGAAPMAMRLALKIDVEGWEARALRGTLDVLDDLADFAALVEVQHASDDDLRWIVERFDMQFYEHATRSLTAAEHHTVDGVKERLRSPAQFYHLDVVLRRKKGPAGLVRS